MRFSIYKLVLISLFVLIVFTPGTIFSKNKSNRYQTLEKACNEYADNWIGLSKFYNSKEEFLNKCLSSIKNKNTINGLWAIRSLIPDGHAGFYVNTKHKKRIYPIALGYDPIKNKTHIIAVYKDSLKKYYGKEVTLINNELPLNLFLERAKLEPNSKYETSLVHAARTLTYISSQLYPDSPKKLKLAFADGSTKTFKSSSFRSLYKHNKYLITRNGKPSLWGDISVQKNLTCFNKNELSKIVILNGSKWLWWHPRSMYFDLNNINDEFRCWEKEAKDADGIIVDLRDTAGGGYYRVLIIANILRSINKLKMPFKTSDNNRDEYIISVPKHNLTKINKKIIMITNEICSSGCETLAEILSKENNVCTYGTPTAGARNGTDDVKIDDNVTIYVPKRGYIDKKGKFLEGTAVIPKHKGKLDLRDLFEKCDLSI